LEIVMRLRAFAGLAAFYLLAAPMGVAAAPSHDVADLGGGSYAIDKQHASVVAKVMHLGVSIYTARFDSFDGSFNYDPGHPENARVQASVDATSMDVGADYSSKFAEEFLGADKFPKITFTSTAIQKGPGNTGTMTGDLTLKGVTKPVTFTVTFVGAGRSPLPPFRSIAGFTATTTIKRSDFGSDFLNNGLVGDDVALTIEAEFDRK
jgi:polyisoprenoid-binding protein YceI